MGINKRNIYLCPAPYTPRDQVNRFSSLPSSRGVYIQLYIPGQVDHYLFNKRGARVVL